MRDLYGRLAAIGYDPDFVRAHVLPEWWEDELAANPATRAMAELTIARMLGLDVLALGEPSASLPPPSIGHARLKRHGSTLARSVAPTLGLAERAARALLAELVAVPPLVGQQSALDARMAILALDRTVTLAGLLRCAWSSGIPVLHLAHVPYGAKKLDGVAMVCGERPVIVLTSRYDSPPWLAFHLAHELGHIWLGHVKDGQPPLVDWELSHLDGDEDEIAASRFACHLLTGSDDFAFAPHYGLTAIKLAGQAQTLGSKNHIDAGSVALFYGHTAKRMPVAQNALKILGATTGAQGMIASELRRHLPNDLPEITERFAALAGVDGWDAA